jgi:chemotaxis protein methyltransferase WspC
MTLRQVERVLSRVIGLEAGSIGSNAVHDAVLTRIQAIGAGSIEEYALLLDRGADELWRLVDEIVVPETWFFRESGSFEYLAQYATSRLRSNARLCVLSIPCATGEEPYSIAMTLFGAGVPASAFSIDAIDISARNIEFARRGRYSSNSFRGSTEPNRLYFTPHGEGYDLAATVRGTVRFTQGNILDPQLFADAAFDVVFCRNLLIYLDRPARDLALGNIRRFLAPGGRIFVGHAESLEFMSHGFRRVAEPRCFAFEPPVTAAPPSAALPAPGDLRSRPAVRERATPTARAEPSKRVRPKPAPAPRHPAEEPASHQRLAPEQLIALARTLADKGELASATKACEQVLASTGPSSAAYCLLGLVKKAAGEPAAALECFNKALYLDQNNYEALVHAALVHEQLGNAAAAAQLRKRAERCIGRTGSS